ncbi:hypothetical protein RJ641_007461 [Dillenia turbinata]|uniref:Uncharacterized protein n=1 Tax=Dillenia turbinata TaxID=194707 RepID=A0AAN8Z5K2_9MAGN
MLPPFYDDQYVLKRNSRARVLNMHSRLGCQVVLTPSFKVWSLLSLKPKSRISMAMPYFELQETNNEKIIDIQY